MANGQPPYVTAQALSRAYAHLRSQGAIQFGFPAPIPPHIPQWMIFIGRLLRAIRPSLSIAAPAALVLALAGLVFVLLRDALRAKPMRRPAALALDGEAGVHWRPEAIRAQILLQEADSLAAEHRFTEAVHLLLLRSVQDIQGRHPGLVRPALTSRDIAGLAALSQPTRLAFGAMADVVEQGVFAGRPVGAEAFAACRQTYERFAFPSAWARGDMAS